MSPLHHVLPLHHAAHSDPYPSIHPKPVQETWWAELFWTVLVITAVALPLYLVSPAKVVIVTDATFEREVLQAKPLVLVEFWSEWSRDSKAMGLTLPSVAHHFWGDLIVCTVESGANRQQYNAYGLQVIPTMLLFKNGKLIAKATGDWTMEGIEAWVNSNMEK